MPTSRRSASIPNKPHMSTHSQMDQLFRWSAGDPVPERLAQMRQDMEAGVPSVMGDGTHHTITSIHIRVNPFDKRSLSAVVHSEFV